MLTIMRRRQPCADSLEGIRQAMASSRGVMGVMGVVRGDAFELRRPRKTRVLLLREPRFVLDPVVVGRLVDTKEGAYVQYGLRLGFDLWASSLIFVGVFVAVPSVVSFLMLVGACAVQWFRYLRDGRDLLLTVEALL